MFNKTNTIHCGAIGTKTFNVAFLNICKSRMWRKRRGRELRILQNWGDNCLFRQGKKKEGKERCLSCNGRFGWTFWKLEQQPKAAIFSTHSHCLRLLCTNPPNLFVALPFAHQLPTQIQLFLLLLTPGLAWIFEILSVCNKC